MQFDKVLRIWSDFFERESIRYVLVGGLAMHAWGRSRLTKDIDFGVEGAARSRTIAHAEALGYETLFESEGFSNHLHADSALGRVDFQYLYGDTAEQIFATADVKLVIGEQHHPVARPEILAAMKGAAMKDSPRRALIDGDDVVHLLTVPGVDKRAIRDYYERHGMLALFDAFEKYSRGR